MRTRAVSRRVGLLGLVLALLTASHLVALVHAAGVDLNGNGMSDVWELVFGAAGLDPNADTSGTGLSNRQKSIAGLNPWDPKSVLRITGVAVAADGSATLRWPSVAGKSYQVQVCPDLKAANWQPLGGAFAGTGGELVASFGPPASGSATAPRFFRITVADLDSDGDGVTDWEELQLGYNPNNRFTPGHGTDANNNPLDDLATIKAALQATTNTVSLVAADPYISLENNGADAGTVLVTRSGRLDAVTVTYTIGGTAVAGTDYQTLSGTVTLPVGVNSALISVRPAVGATAGPTAKTVVLNLAAGPNYTPAAAPANTATVTLGAKANVGQVLQEVWLNLTGWDGIEALVGSPTTSRVLSSLDMPQSNPDVNNFGTRIRGYLVPPATGNYTFWIASDDKGEFWLSTDDQPANRTRRAWVNSWTGYRQWNRPTSGTDPTPVEPNQRSPVLALVAGQRYYFEVLQREYGGGDHVSIGWLKPTDPAASLPSEVVPGTVGTGTNLKNILLPYVPPVTAPDGSTLYFATLTPQGAATSNGSGSATLRVSADERYAVLSLNYSNLTGPKIAQHIHGPADPGQSAGIIFDIDTTTPQSDGTWVWNIAPTGTYSAADLVAAIKSGRTYVNVHTAQYPNGEIRGQFTRTAGATANFTPPSDPPAWTDDHANANAASRFLTQSTFGPSPETIAQVQRDGYAAFLDGQFAVPPTLQLPHLDAYEAANPGMTYYDRMQEAWWTAAVKGSDQLRQRVAFALSETFVISYVTISDPFALSSYYDTLTADAFGNFRQLLEDATLHPAMGNYLNALGNDKPDPSRGINPNENYAREILQLFSIGLNRLNPDGTLLLGSNNQPVPTYNQTVITNLARVFTGWHYNQAGAQNWPYVPYNTRQPMEPVAAHHDGDAKTVLDGVVLPAGQSARQDLKDTLDLIFNHPNVGPFISRQLIQRLVTSNPSPAYIYRVAKVFANNGQGVRGDLRATVRAILLDYEARNPVSLTGGGAASFGHQREPMVRFANLLRAFHGGPVNGGYLSPPWDPADLGQQPLYAPTVFNFFEPGYAQPGDIAAAGLVSPEFQITGDTQVIKTANYLRNTIYRQPSAQYDPNGIWVVLNPTADQLALADTPSALVDNLNTLLMAGQMSATMRTTVLNNVSAITNSNVTTQRQARAAQAIYLIVTSPEFAIQK